MVSEWKKRKSFDIISKQKKQYQRKDFLMKPIISQNLLNVLKNKIIPIISLNLFNDVEFLLNNLFVTDGSNHYFNLIYKIQTSARNIVKSIVTSTFEELDHEFKESVYRKSRYFVNKSNVSRTLVTIVGEITFKRTYYVSKYSNKRFFYIDKIFDLPKNDHYDPIVKAITISKAISTSQAQSVRDTSSLINDLSYFESNSIIKDIPRQSVYNWIRNWCVPNIVPKSVNTPETLYVMADEKYIGAQDIDKDIMIKSFIVFEDVINLSKNRRKLVNRTAFSHYGNKPWVAFMDFIAMKYDFDKIKNICLFGDGASWIKSGTDELRLSQNNSVKFFLCEFHFKQAIHHITTNAEERYYLLHIFKNKPKSYFVDAVNTIIYNNQSRKDTITKKLNYIVNNYTNIKSILNLNIGSSMESHISHLIASWFSSRPKGFSTKRITKYLKLNDYKNNNINIFKLYLSTYSKKKTTKLYESTFDYEIFTPDKIHNIPVLNYGQNTGTYIYLNNISHDVSTETYISNET